VIQSYFTENDMKYQLVYCHRRNAAENAIRTFKEHFVAGLSSVDPDFPMHLWDFLLPQAEITLNLLRTSRLHPQLSLAAHFHGLIDYNKTAFSPPGCTLISLAQKKAMKEKTIFLGKRIGVAQCGEAKSVWRTPHFICRA
jgi:hypothetical protein